MSERIETKRCIKALHKYSSFPFFLFPRHHETVYTWKTHDIVNDVQKRNAAQLTRLHHQLREVHLRGRQFASEVDRINSRITQMTSQLTSQSAAATD